MPKAARPPVKTGTHRAKRPVPACTTGARRSKGDPNGSGLVPFSFQEVAYQIDPKNSKVYRRFIEIEKSRQGSILTAYRAVAGPGGPSL